MSYDCTDAYSAIMSALNVNAPEDTPEGQIVSVETDLALATIRRLRGADKAGIRRIKNVNTLRAPSHAMMALACLRNALDHCKAAGACYTAARIRSAISSAKGAVRAAQYRQARAARKGQS